MVMVVVVVGDERADQKGIASSLKGSRTARHGTVPGRATPRHAMMMMMMTTTPPATTTATAAAAATCNQPLASCSLPPSFPPHNIFMISTAHTRQHTAQHSTALAAAADDHDDDDDGKGM